MSHPLSPAEIASLLEKAEQLKIEANHKGALDLLEKILLADPENTTALEEVADNELSLEHYRRAEAAAKRAIALDATSYTGHYILGFLRSRAGEWKKASTHLQEANRHKANNAEILRCLGWALFNDGQRLQGVVTLERALNLEEDNPFILCDLGVAYLHLQNFSKAKALFMHALHVDPENARVKECIQAVERLEKEYSGKVAEKSL